MKKKIDELLTITNGEPVDGFKMDLSEVFKIALYQTFWQRMFEGRKVQEQYWHKLFLKHVGTDPAYLPHRQLLFNLQTAEYLDTEGAFDYLVNHLHSRLDKDLKDNSFAIAKSRHNSGAGVSSNMMQKQLNKAKGRITNFDLFDLPNYIFVPEIEEARYENDK